MTQVPRTPDMIQRVVDTIWADGQRVKCPVCAAPMQLDGKGYDWHCHTEHCPISSVEFNEGVHNYGVRSRPKWPNDI